MESLRKKKDFQAVFQNGKRFFSPYATLFVLPRDDLGTRVGIVVGVKTAKKAVVRNRVRRRVREALRTTFKEWPLSRGIDIVVLPKPVVLDAPFEMLKSGLKDAILKFPTSKSRIFKQSLARSEKTGNSVKSGS